MTIVADQIADKVLARARGRKLPSFRDFYRTMKYPKGLLAGKNCNPDSDPNQRWLIEQFDSGQWERVIVCAPPQFSGKTQVCILLPALRGVIKQRLPVGYALPTLEDLDKAWTERIRFSFLNTGYGECFPEKGPGSQGGRPAAIQFVQRDTGELLGQLIFMAAAAYGSTVAIVLVDEVDQFFKAGQPDWNGLGNILSRPNAYRDRAMRVLVGTLEHDEDSIILELDREGSGTRPWALCPFCSRHQRFLFENVKAIDLSDERGVAESAYLACQHCPARLTNDDRLLGLRYEHVRYCHRGQSVDAAGAIVGTGPRTRSCSLIWNGLESTQTSLGDMAIQRWRGLTAAEGGNHEPLRKFTNYYECRPYTRDREELEQLGELTWQKLLERAQLSPYGPSEALSDRLPGHDDYLYSRHRVRLAPEGAHGCIPSIDVQIDRVYWGLRVFALDGTSWAMAWGFDYARADHRPWNRTELHALLDRIDGVIDEYSAGVPRFAGGIDTGFGTDDLMPWIKVHRDRWLAVKGQPQAMKVERGDIEGIVHVRDGLYHVRTDATRDLVHAALRRKHDSIGCLHLPNGLVNNASDRAYLQHLVGEQRVVDLKTRRDKVKSVGRWDWLDVERYAEALLRWHLAQLSKPARRTVNARDWFKKRGR